MLAYAQELVCNLKELMPTQYQKDNLRETKDIEKQQILATLEAQKTKLNEYLSQLALIQASLDTWKPM
ncbi:hypothetical protein [Halotia branconii]|uniref:Uncharacterized protein n=1 Tax=Halotia branconii CENA392 TaxID=1539056 RepID=A0AAJ6PB57_9CYAN|nr:hypothetical protein [Halotia branconii]WGV27495.1 hypothetical protein QI031_08405 [Halotia branconii CENA392]